jgi:hypothetical protein
MQPMKPELDFQDILSPFKIQYKVNLLLFNDFNFLRFGGRLQLFFQV